MNVTRMNVTRWCAECAADAVFETPECVDHPEACVVLSCVLCGAGIELVPARPAQLAQSAAVA